MMEHEYPKSFQKSQFSPEHVYGQSEAEVDWA